MIYFHQPLMPPCFKKGSRDFPKTFWAVSCGFLGTVTLRKEIFFELLNDTYIVLFAIIEFQVVESFCRSFSLKQVVRRLFAPKSVGDSTKSLAPSLCRYRPYYGIMELPACRLIRPAIKPVFFKWGGGIGGSCTPEILI